MRACTSCNILAKPFPILPGQSLDFPDLSQLPLGIYLSWDQPSRRRPRCTSSCNKPCRCWASIRKRPRLIAAENRRSGWVRVDRVTRLVITNPCTRFTTPRPPSRRQSRFQRTTGSVSWARSSPLPPVQRSTVATGSACRGCGVCAWVATARTARWRSGLAGGQGGFAGRCL